MGPEADILLPAPLSADDRERIADEVAALAGQVEEKQDVIDFWIDGRPFTIIYPARYGDAKLHQLYFEQLSDYEGLDTVTGWVVREYLDVFAACNDDTDHRALATLCIRIAELFQGLIAFGLTLDRYTRDRAILAHPGAIHWDRFKEEHILTPGFLKVWLRHPDFRMVK